MKRALILTPAFGRAAKRVVKRQPQIAVALQQTLERLAADAYDPRLRTHKLTGALADSWACSVAYDLRIVFEFVTHDGVEAIFLQTVGTHDEVY